jgi:YggT family protein
MIVVDLIRYAVFGVFVASAAVAVGSWAVRTRRIHPFSRTGQLVRRASDVVLSPFETWLVRRGGLPQNAPWWLLGVTVAGGIIVVTAAEALGGLFVRVGAAAASGPRGVLHLIVFLTGWGIITALVIRVIASWFGAGRYNPWVRWTYPLTDWCILPLRKIIPPIGMFDLSPLIAFFLLQFLLSAILSFI